MLDSFSATGNFKSTRLFGMIAGLILLSISLKPFFLSLILAAGSLPPV